MIFDLVCCESVYGNSEFRMLGDWIWVLGQVIFGIAGVGCGRWQVVVAFTWWWIVVLWRVGMMGV